MIKSHEEDEFIAVRVQDPRIQNEGSWNSYVDYKIFLHTNSKAFTAKTSCVRRRYSEFAWLRKRLQKNTGLVPVADLPGRSFFSFSNEDFLESRRTGLQLFLDKVLHTTVCLSDSQLHLFLQTQLPVGHILDCVQGHTPYTVTDAILTYASSNQGWAQAQEEDPTQEPSSLTQVPYESMESPAPHLPIMQNKEANPALITSHDPDHPQSTVEVQDIDTVELQFSNDETPSLKVLQKNNHLEALLERHSPGGATFFLGDIHDETGPERSSPEEDIQPRTYRIQTPVDVHSPMGTGFQDDREMGLEGVIEDDGTVREESCITLDQAKEMIDPSALSIPYHGTREEEDRQGDSLRLEVLECHVLSQEPVLEHVISQEHVTECDDSAEEQVLEHVISKEVLEHVSSEAVPEHVISEEVPDQAISEDQILEHVSSHEEELLDYVGSVETVVEQIHSEEQATKHGSSEEKVLEQVHSEEQAPEHHVSTDGVLEHVSPEEKVTEQGSCAEQVLDYVPSEEHILEHVSFEDQIVEWVSSHEEQLFEEEVPEHVHSEEEAPDQHVSSDDVLEHIYKNNVLEHAHSVAQAQEHLCSEHNVSTDDKVLEHVSSEKVLEGSFLCNEEQVPKNVSLPEEGVLEVGCNEESRSSGGEMDESDNQEHLNETELNLEISEEEKRTVECGGDGTIQEQQTPLDQDCSDQEVDETSDKEDGHLSDKCLNKDSDGEEEEVIQETNGYIEIAGEVSENQNTDILEVQASKRPTETDRSSEANDAQEEENAAYMTNNGSLDKGLDSSGSVGSGDLTKSSESDIQDSK